MKPDEAKKALNICINDDCDNCLNTFGNCQKNLLINASNVIDNQLAEIEKLKKEQERFADIGKMYSEIRAEAIKEFAEKFGEFVLENHYMLTNNKCGGKGYGLFTTDIDTAVKATIRKMVGENNV